MNSNLMEQRYFGLPPDFDAAELFDLYGSDGIIRDERDDEHNYWIPIDEVAAHHLSSDYVEFVDDEVFGAELRDQLLAGGNEPVSRDAKIVDRPMDAAEREFLISTFGPDDVDEVLSKVEASRSEAAALAAKFSRPKAKARSKRLEPKKEPSVSPKVGTIAAYVPKFFDDNKSGLNWKYTSLPVQVAVRKHRYVDGNEVCRDEAAFMAMPKNLRARLSEMAL